MLLALVSLARSGGPLSFARQCRFGLCCALLFLVSPQLGLAGYAGIALLMLRHVPARRWAGIAAILFTAFALTLSPWLLRNEAQFGKPLLRSNLGLELAIAFHPAAVHPADARQAYIDRMRDIHPLGGWKGFHRMQAAGGEVAYSAQLQAETRAWIVDHPGSAALLAVRHLVQYVFPPVWSFKAINPADDRMLAAKAVLIWGLTALGLVGMIRRLITDPKSGFTYLAVAVVVTALPFMLVQPILRYRYLIYVPMTFYAADAAVWMVTRWPVGRRFVGWMDGQLAAPA